MTHTRPSAWRASGAAAIAAALATMAGPHDVLAQVPQLATTAPAAAPAAPAPGEGEPLYAAPTREDRSGRILAAVEIDGQGPYRFILDTGANSSALAPQVAEQLRLPPAGEVSVHGVTGTAVVPAVRVETMRAGDVVQSAAILPVLPGNIFNGADGILGISGMQEMRIDVDFLHDRVTISRSRGWRATSSFVTIKATLWQGGLLLVTGRVGSILTQIIIDTGAERTMGNVPLRQAIVARSRPGEEFATTVFGATADTETGTYFRAPRISIGSSHLNDQPVTFGDLHVFDLWGLTDVPALVIGMDVLGRFERFVVDYRRKEFQISARSNGKAFMRKCTATDCGSRIPASDGG